MNLEAAAVAAMQGILANPLLYDGIKRLAEEHKGLVEDYVAAAALRQARALIYLSELQAKDARQRART